MASERSAAVRPVLDDLQQIFGDRLHAVIVYGWRPNAPVPTVALVEALTFDDLHACTTRVGRWHRAGAATPLLLPRDEFTRSLDAFPVEYGEIIQHHEVIFGRDPFAGLTIAREDLRRACEVQVKSHLLHLREDYVESAGHHGEIAALVRESAPGFEALLRQLSRLDGHPVEGRADLIDWVTRRAGLDARSVGDVLAVADAGGGAGVDPVKLFPAYLRTMERLAEFVDRWRAA